MKFVYFFNNDHWFKIKTDNVWVQNLLSAFPESKNGNCVAAATLSDLYEILRKRAPMTFNPNWISTRDFSENVVVVDFDQFEYWQDCYPMRKRKLEINFESRADFIMNFDYQSRF